MSDHQHLGFHPAVPWPTVGSNLMGIPLRAAQAYGKDVVGLDVVMHDTSKGSSLEGHMLCHCFGHVTPAEAGVWVWGGSAAETRPSQL
ncbi:hypothetical protein GJAV_G00072410 [Gymnothorax javanicus]|nr:hypothetical protein GJAV_G00072410 [Gymnothorax javanicus]